MFPELLYNKNSINLQEFDEQFGFSARDNTTFYDPKITSIKENIKPPSNIKQFETNSNFKKFRPKNEIINNFDGPSTRSSMTKPTIPDSIQLSSITSKSSYLFGKSLQYKTEDKL